MGIPKEGLYVSKEGHCVPKEGLGVSKEALALHFQFLFSHFSFLIFHSSLVLRPVRHPAFPVLDLFPGQFDDLVAALAAHAHGGETFLGHDGAQPDGA